MRTIQLVRTVTHYVLMAAFVLRTVTHAWMRNVKFVSRGMYVTAVKMTQTKILQSVNVYRILLTTY
jgi:hypothetical protein